MVVRLYFGTFFLFESDDPMEWLHAYVFRFTIAFKSASQLQDSCRILKLPFLYQLSPQRLTKHKRQLWEFWDLENL